MLTQFELLNFHVDALFLKNGKGRLVSVNEPWDQTKPTPLMYVGRTLMSETVMYVRYDVDDAIFSRAADLIQSGMTEPHVFMELFHAPVLFQEVCYSVPVRHHASNDCIALTKDNLRDFDLQKFSWLTEEIGTAQPCCAYLEDGKVVSVCRSVRISKAHEAGIETAAQYRGRGYAQKALSAWSMEVSKLGKTPLYSTSKINLSSQRVASKLGLQLYATGFSIGVKI